MLNNEYVENIPTGMSSFETIENFTNSNNMHICYSLNIDGRFK